MIQYSGNSNKDDGSHKEQRAWQVKEFCVAYRISHATFYKYRALGKIKTIRIGGRVLIPAAEALRIASEGI